MADDLPDKLISFLERINPSYIDPSNNFKAKDIALICVSENHMLYEEIFTIYCNFSKPVYILQKRTNNLKYK